MLKVAKNNVPFIQSPLLGPVSHGFFTRQGGVSQGFYESLNCCFRGDDTRENVLKNRSLTVEALSLTSQTLVTVKQVHGKDVAIVDESWDPNQEIEVDALVTRSPSFILGIQTADCVPVLLIDPEKQVIGAAHAGWRGALKGVVEETISAMVGLGARKDKIFAAIGPSIAEESYEVGPEVYEMFIEKDPENKRFFKPYPSSTHTHLNLPGFVESILSRSGVQVERLLHNTYADPALFFSCRRAQHDNTIVFGGHISLISLQKGTHAA
jgi:YfiH family protein